MNKHKYENIAMILEDQIKGKVLLPGDKLPSLRRLCTDHDISQSTALSVYDLLQAGGYAESRDRSGYFVSRLSGRIAALPFSSQPAGKESAQNLDKLAEEIFSTAGPGHIKFSYGAPSSKLLPVARLNKELVKAARNLESGGTAYTETQGNEKLRRQVIRHAPHLGSLKPDDLITTSGCNNALALALMATTSPGDRVGVESPYYFGLSGLARSLGIKLVELPCHALTGPDLEMLECILQKRQLQAIIVVSNFSNPMGGLMPPANKEHLVKLIERFQIPLIEDDIYGDIYFGKQRPDTCKSYDSSGLVLLCSSFTKTIAPGYRVGWIAPGKFREKVLQLKLSFMVCSASLTEEAIAGFMETSHYQKHLKQLRQTLYANYLQYSDVIGRYFPEGTRLSQPQGGLFLWVEFDSEINTLQLFKQAIRLGISIAPGQLFTREKQFSNCMRLNFGLPWNPQLEQALKTIGHLAKMLGKTTNKLNN